jgi:hypothetical protein
MYYLVLLVFSNVDVFFFFCGLGFELRAYTLSHSTNPFFIFFNYYLFIHTCIHCLGHFSPLTPALTFFPFPPSLPGRTCSVFFSSSVEE